MLRASAPLTLFTANHPMPAMTELSRAGMMLPTKPNALRAATICGSPVLGPIEDR